MEKALKQQLLKAVKEEWVKPLCNPTTNVINFTIPGILAFLFTEYDHVNTVAAAHHEEVKQLT